RSAWMRLPQINFFMRCRRVRAAIPIPCYRQHPGCGTWGSHRLDSQPVLDNNVATPSSGQSSREGVLPAQSANEFQEVLMHTRLLKSIGVAAVIAGVAVLLNVTSVPVAGQT